MPDLTSKTQYHLAIAIAAALLLGAASHTLAATTIAVASNFRQPALELQDNFETATGHRLKISFGSTGKLFAQIQQGAPFALLLAADAERPQRLVDKGQADANSHHTYALGRLVLYSRDPNRINGGPEALYSPTLRGLAIANPKTAPYGVAAIEVLNQLNLYTRLQGQLRIAGNVGQAWQFVATGNTDLGLVSASLLNTGLGGSLWRVPETLHRPIQQDMVLLNRGLNDPAARAFHQWLLTDAARQVIKRYGYSLPARAH